MTDSILTSTKKLLGIDEAYKVFDPDIITHINSIFSILNQLGIGPDDGFMVEDDTRLWDEYLVGDFNLNDVKSYMYIRVRLLFDPPTTSYLITALEKQFQELEWRMNVHREMEKYPLPPEVPEEVYREGLASTSGRYYVASRGSSEGSDI